MGGGVKFCLDNFELEFSHILWEIVDIADMGIGEPGGGFGSGVCAQEGCLKISDKVWESPKRGGVEGCLLWYDRTPIHFPGHVIPNM